MSVEGGPDGNAERDPAAVVRDQLYREAQSVKQEQVDRAVQRLAADHKVTDAERKALEQLGSRLTEAVLRGAESQLDVSDPATAQAIANLFQVE